MEFNSQDAISSKEATAFMTIDGENIELFFAESLTASLTKNKKEIRSLGKRMVGYKTTSAQGKGTLKVHDITSIFKEKFLEYVKNGVDIYFSIMVTNEDKSTTHGRETKILTGCNFDEISIASFDTADEVLEQELNFTYEGVELTERFK